MNLNDVVSWFNEIVRQHEAWAIPIIFFLAFGESLAFLSLLLPATVVLLALGAFIGQSEMGFSPVWMAATVGAFLGDWLSYWFGYHYQERVSEIWPLSRHPNLLVRGHTFFERWGVLGIFFGRFFGPLRSVVPLVAGICAMPRIPFQIANMASAMIWAFGVLAPGVYGIKWLSQWVG